MKYFLTVALFLLIAGNICMADGTTVLADFDGGHETIQRFQVRRPAAALELAGWPDGFPGQAGKLTFARYVRGGEAWPAIILPEKAIPAVEWSRIGKMSLEVFAPEHIALTFHFRFESGGKKLRRDKQFQVPPGRRTLMVPRSFFDELKPDAVLKELHLFSERPAKEQAVYLGKLSVDMVDPAREAAARAKEQEQMKQQLRTISASARNDIAGLWQSGTLAVERDEYLFDHLSTEENGEVSVAQGESEGIQLILLPTRALPDVRLEIAAPFKNAGGAVLADDFISIMPVGYVWCDRPGNYDVSRTGFRADPVLNYVKSMPLEPGKFQPYLIDVSVPPGQAPGQYRGTVAVKSGTRIVRDFPLIIRVRNFRIPAGTPYPQLVDMGARSLSKYLPDLKTQQTYRNEVIRLALDHRIQPTGLYNGKPPTVAEVREWIGMGLDRFCLLYINCSAAEAKGGKFPAAKKQRILAMLDDAVPKFREAGLLKHAFLYAFDEANSNSYDAIADILGEIRRRYPELPIATTVYDFSFGADSKLDSLIDIWTPLLPKYEANAESIGAARKRGRKVFWYNCIAPVAPYPNFFIEYPVTDSRLLMGALAWKYRIDGYLYYALALWQDHRESPDGKWSHTPRIKPISGAPLTDWPGASWRNNNGDGALIYLGKSSPVPTLRLKAIRDGVEDFWYLQLLSHAVAAVADGRAAMPGEWVAQASAMLNVPESVASDLRTFTRDPEELRSWREKLASLLEVFVERGNGSFLLRENWSKKAASPDDAAWNQRFDEQRVPSYQLPPLFDRPCDRQEWETRIRPKWLAMLAREEYGRIPPALTPATELLSESVAFRGKGVRREYRLTFRGGGGERQVRYLLYTPRGASAEQRVPLFLSLNFRGNHSVDPAPEIGRAATGQMPGFSMDALAVDRLLDAGFAVGTAFYQDFFPDRADGRSDSIYRLFPAEEFGDSGAVSAWAWGMSRLLEFSLTQGGIDAGRIFAVGHSRLGKAALWAAANDRRFAGVAANDSGCGGAALHRRRFGERISDITSSFPHWFSPGLRAYAEREADLPFDQHMLLAMIPPRKLYIASATQDLWADPRGEFLALGAVKPVYELYGIRAVDGTAPPLPDTPLMKGGSAYHIRSGGHAITAADWRWFAEFFRGEK